jgi:superfamily II DNA or RNA helicase
MPVMGITTKLAVRVPATIRDRGREYFLNGAVRIESITVNAIAATVTGSEPYDVDLYLEGRAVYASCTCPYAADHGTACKHIWAALLAAEGRAFGGGAQPTQLIVEDAEAEDEDDGEYYDDDYDAPRRYAEPAYPRLPAYPHPRAADDWKTTLAALSREVQPPAPTVGRARRQPDRQLLYVADVAASAAARRLVLEVNFRERKLNGEWGKPKAQTLSQSQIDALADPTDRQLFALLRGAERGDPYGHSYGYAYSSYGYGYGVPRFRVAGPLLDAVLPLLVASGRLRLKAAGPPAELAEVVADLDPPYELSVGVTRDEGKKGGAKKWVLSGALRRGDRTVPLSAPALVVPGLVFHDGRMTRLADSDTYPWVPVLRQSGAIAVPVNKSAEFLGQLLQMPHLPKLDLPEELRYTEEVVAPRPRLTVKAAKPRYSGGPVLEAELSFDYGGEVVPAGTPGRGNFDAATKRFLVRDAAAEAAAVRELTRLGAREARRYGSRGLELKPAALPKVVRELVGAGWHVEAEGKLYRQAGEFKMAVSTGNDWFDLNATADFGGKQVSLPQLLAALGRGENTVALDDGTFGMVPEDWLKKYGLLARMGTVEGDKVRFGRSQVGVLDALLATRPEVTFDEQFAHARDELKRFQGVAPADPPPGFRGELRGYQREGLGWLRFLRAFGFGGCLADDMGLGKTVQVLALLAGERNGPALVVVPRSLVFNWKQEAAKFAPALKVLDHTGAGRDKTGAGFKDHDVVLTTYGTLRNDAATFADFRFDTCVLDESQAAKNAETETAKAVRLINADNRLALSGTPVENHLGELWTLFNFLNPGMLGRAALLSGAGPVRNLDAETREILGKALRPFILRRTKAQVAKDLPAKTEQTVYCDLEPDQRKLYDELRDHYRRSLLTQVEKVGLARSKIQVLEALLRLRQAACHPGLIDKSRTADPSAKLDLLLPQLKEVAEEGHKALVFSQFTSLLSIVKKRLDAETLTYEYLDGRTRDRQARVDRFQTDPTCPLFLISLKAGGVGLNLTAAEYVFLLDPWWNPAVEAQAIDRSHRIGQTKPVFAYRIIARNTVEEKVLALQESKRQLADAILGGDGNLITDLKREDLELLLS